MAITMDGIFVNGQKATFRPEDILTGDASAYTEEIGTAVEAWMEENVTGGEQVTDTTLTLPGVPADAKVTGNKIDELKENSQQALAEIVDRWHDLLPKAEILPISAKNKFGIDMLLKRIQELLPESPAYFDKDQLTDKPARFFVSEIIREKILLYYDKEIPYSVEVRVESFKEDEKHIHINALIYVERDSQKGIIIGHQGVALKKVSTEARKSLEKFFGKPIFLEIFVKVDKDWRSSERELDSFGYNPE